MILLLKLTNFVNLGVYEYVFRFFKLCEYKFENRVNLNGNKYFGLNYFTILNDYNKNLK